MERVTDFHRRAGVGHVSSPETALNAQLAGGLISLRELKRNLPIYLLIDMRMK